MHKTPWARSCAKLLKCLVLPASSRLSHQLCKPTVDVDVHTSLEFCYRINTKRRRGKYYLRSNGQSKWVSSITLLGFSSLPSGLKRNGGGLVSGGYLLLRYLSEKLKSLELIIDAENNTTIQRSNHRYRVTLNHNDLRRVLRALRAVNGHFYEERRGEVLGFLHQCFSKKFKAVKTDKTAYGGGELSRVLDKRELIENLAPRDIESLSGFFPDFIKVRRSGKGKKEAPGIHRQQESDLACADPSFQSVPSQV